MTVISHSLPMTLTEVEVAAVQRLSPSFVRVELAGAELADFGVEGPLHDQRIKLVFPNAAGELESFAGADDSWFATWLAIPADERGHMRTYTVRSLVGSGIDTRVVVDIVLHEPPHGPGSTWAFQASVGDRLVLLGPRRGLPFGGIEFEPGEARQLLLVGDETAVPAICSIVESLPAGTVGIAFLEVPVADDLQDVRAPEGFEVRWLPRDGQAHGTCVIPAVLAHLGSPVADVELVAPELPEDVELWETPTYSATGEDLTPGAVDGPLDGLYAWIAGESSIVTTLRRHLVRDLGVDRSQVAFMGYWRRGVAMRS